MVSVRGVRETGSEWLVATKDLQRKEGRKEGSSTTLNNTDQEIYNTKQDITRKILNVLHAKERISVTNLT